MEICFVPLLPSQFSWRRISARVTESFTGMELLRLPLLRQQTMALAFSFDAAVSHAVLVRPFHYKFMKYEVQRQTQRQRIYILRWSKYSNNGFGQTSWRSCKRWNWIFTFCLLSLLCSSPSTTLLLLLDVLELALGRTITSLHWNSRDLSSILTFFFLHFLSHSSMGHRSKEIVHSIGQTRYQLKRTNKSHEISNVQIWQCRRWFNDTQFPQNCNKFEVDANALKRKNECGEKKKRENMIDTLLKWTYTNRRAIIQSVRFNIDQLPTLSVCRQSEGAGSALSIGVFIVSFFIRIK